MRRERLLRQYFETMLAALGESGWWPAETPFEVAVGAILTQNTAWTNVERAITALKAADVLSPAAMLALPEAHLAELIRPAGYFRVKAKRLRHFLTFLQAHGGDILALREVPHIRERLLEVSGIGPETADSILLYALEIPSFVVDAYTRRIFHRHGLVPEDISYENLRAYFADALTPDVNLYKEFHALIVRTAKEWCRAKPRCALCPLAPLLPSS
ncbi:MAG: endonuclease [Desulfomicrobiaceae bacterium]|jgi:endonuclease-3 related protein|nr:endonuclease [Desulfomicrobiaceae bacterium]